MPLKRLSLITFQISCVLMLTLTLSACDYLNNLINLFERLNTDQTETTTVSLSLAVSPHIARMPWFLAEEEKLFKNKDFIQTHGVEIQFVTGEYKDIIGKFTAGEVNAITITNIDAIAQLVRQDIEADVILITSYSHGNEAILLPGNTNTNALKLRGKKFALFEFSTRHYLLDRYLVRNQIPFDDVDVINTPEADIPNVFGERNVYGVVTTQPNIDKLKREASAKALFDSREIPGEIFDLLVIRREVLQDNPHFAQALLATWFSVMERLQGNRKGSTLEAMSRLAGLSKEDFDRHIALILLNDTSNKALSAIRDRKLRKTMRHIRYFMERHNLTGDEPFISWVSYPGRTPALLHFNGEPLQDFVVQRKNKKL